MQDPDRRALVARAPLKPLNCIGRELDIVRRPDGVILLCNAVRLGDHEPTLAGRLRRGAHSHPERTWLAQRRGAERHWVHLSYVQAQERADRLTQALLDLARPARAVMILSGSSLEHGVLKIAAMQARMPCVPVSPAYALQAPDMGRLQQMVDRVRPAVVFVQNAAVFRRAMAELAIGDATWLVVDEAPQQPGVARWADWSATVATDAVAASVSRIGPDTVLQYLFTSGSTGMPKAVTMTHGMVAASVAIHQQTHRKPAGEPPSQQLDWLPWNHVAGGTAVFWGTLNDGGTVYLDEGRPAPGAFDETLRNLRDVSPSAFGSVPIGYAMLAEALERDAELAGRFFSQLKRLTYSGASLPDSLFERMQALAVTHTGHRLPFVSAFGSTETSAAVMSSYWGSEHPGCVGLPQPGVALKLLPMGDARYEVRVRSPAVTPGYLGEPELTRTSFDEEGYFRMGDALSFIDPSRPGQGLVFSGRVTEEFKLQSGIFVRVGELRLCCVEAAGGLLADVVVAGADQPFVALLAWPHLDFCRRRLGQDVDLPTLVRTAWLREAVQRALQAHNLANPGSSRRIQRVLLLDRPPSMGSGEVTDKGYVNQRAVLTQRAIEVDKLYAEVPPEEVIVLL